MNSLVLPDHWPHFNQTCRQKSELPPSDADAWLIWPRGGNTGDLLILLACERFLRDQGIRVWLSDGSIEEAALANDDAYLDASLAAFRGMVFFTGGGNIGIYPDNGQIRAAIIAKLRPYHRCLVFPQSAYGMEASLASPLVTVWCRDAASRNILRDGGVNTELVPDIALYMDDVIPKMPTGEGVYFIKRTRNGDTETIDHGIEFEASSADLTLSASLNQIIASLAPYEYVLSDRLHGALIALMMRKKTLLLPVGYHKVQAFHDTWLRDVKSAAYVTRSSEIQPALADLQVSPIDLKARFNEHARPAFSRFLSDRVRSMRAATVSPEASSAQPPPTPAMGSKVDLQRDGVVPGTAGVCMVRDSLDIIPFVCGHYLRLGFEHLHFIDDGSSDGTFEFLADLSRKTSRVSVQRILGDEDRQGDVVSLAMNKLIARGFFTVFPFDADEFWNLTRDQLRVIAKRQEDRIIPAAWVNFVQARKRHHPAPFGMFAIQFRAQAQEGVYMDQVFSLQEPFVCIQTMPKVAVWSREPVQLGVGQHGVLQGPSLIEEEKREIFHVPFRWRSELTKRALNYEPRRAIGRTSLDQSWQSRFHREIVLNGQDEAVWAANSVDAAGCLDVYGNARALHRDTRLRNALVLAAMHMLRRFGVLCL